MGIALWSFMWTRGYLGEARRWLEAALESPDLSQDVRTGALHAAGILAHDQGDYECAGAYFEEALELRRELGDMHGIAQALSSLGVFRHHRGEYDRARPLYEESLALLQKLGDQHRISVVLNNLGVVAERQGDNEQASDYYNRSLEVARKLNDNEGSAWALDNLGNIACLRGNYDEAWKLHQESLSIFQELGHKQGIAVCLEHMASLAGAMGQPEEARQAARLYGAAQAFREASGSVMHPTKRHSYEERVAAIRTQIDDEEWQAAWAAGRSMTLEQVLTLPIKERNPQ
jgi:tetratricopeptide (TPR) repeat protein